MKTVIYTIASFTVTLALWELAVLAGDFDSALFPAPQDVAKAFGEIVANGTLYDGIAASMLRFVIGYLISVVAGIALGLLIGIGDAPAIVIIFLAGFFPVLLTTARGVHSVDTTYLKVASNYGISRLKTVFGIILPAAFPQIANSLHIALGSAWIFLVSGEMVGTQSGLGYMIIDARNNLRPDILLATMIVIGGIGFVLDFLIGKFEKKVLTHYGVH